MKKIFSLGVVMLGVMALVCTSCKKSDPTPSTETTLTLPAAAEVTVGQSTTITATITPAVSGATVAFASSDATIAAATGDGQTCIITGVSAGSATITATYNGKTAQCVVTVTSGGGSEYPVLQGEDYFAIFMDATTAGSLGNKVKYNFGTNDENRWLYVWENTFVGADPSGNNPFDLPEGWVCMKQSATTGWAGCGFCYAINGTAGEYQEAADADLVALNSLATTITDYSKWDLVIAMKKAQTGVGYECKLIGGNVGGTESGAGSVMITDTNCPADDEWHIISFPLNEIVGLEFGQWTNYGSNLFTIVANPYVANGDLNLGAAFIYRAR